MDTRSLIYLHGSDSNSNSGKARLFREWFPGMLTPDFTGTFDERMTQLYSILSDKTGWTIIGSSYGGLMGTVFTCRYPQQVYKLILLAPALLRDSDGAYLDPITGEYLIHLKDSDWRLQQVSVPTIVVHGTQDDIVPVEPVRRTAQTLFTDLTYHIVNDDHRLGKSVLELDWETILA
jgi:pimeloyl-ACP methyl ester carboxylesterase